MNISIKKEILFALLLNIFSIGIVKAQSYKEFNITLQTKETVDSCLYNKLEFIDSRTFNKYLGFVQTKLFNEYTPIVDKPSIEQQFKNVFLALNPNRKGNNTLVIQLRRLYFSEATKKTAEYGYCHIRSNIYKKAGDNLYFPISAVDTVLTLKTWTDVTNNLLKKNI